MIFLATKKGIRNKNNILHINNPILAFVKHHAVAIIMLYTRI